MTDATSPASSAPPAGTSVPPLTPGRLLIDGAWQEAVDGSTLSIVDPCRESHLPAVAAAASVDVDRAVAAARRALDDPAWRDMRPNVRSRLMLKLADLLERDLEQLARWESLSMGMPLSLARAAGVPSAIEELRYNAGWCTRIHGATYSLGVPGSSHAFTLREPVGVVAAIVPWNFPLVAAMVKVAPALATGCTVVLKPAEQTPYTALRLGELVLEAGFPPGVLNVLTGEGSVAGAALAEHPGVDKITFTGSTVTGRRITAAATANFKKVTLELGGKSPALILEDADLARAVPACATGIFANSGQICAAASRLYVHERIYDDVISMLRECTKPYRLGDWDDPATTMGPLASARQLAKVVQFVDEAAKQGANVLTGGRRLERHGFFYPPTIIAPPGDDLRICREEVFGPVLVVQRARDVDEMVQRANDSPYGLAANVWTRDTTLAHSLVRRIKAGSVYVNAIAIAGPSFPFGGFKQSGWGRERGWEGLEAFLQTKSVGFSL